MSASTRALAPALVMLAGVVLASASSAESGGLFQFEDENGVVNYTNVPSDPRFRPSPGWIESPRDTVPTGVPAPTGNGFTHAIRAAAERYGVDPRLVEAVVVVESGGNPRAVSPKGALGLMQLMPQRAVGLGVRDPFDPLDNLDGGVRHLRDLLGRFNGDVVLALAAYNAGEQAVRSHGGIPPYPETQRYVRKIQALYDDPPRAAVGTSAAPPRPEPVYQQVGLDGSVVYTNLPPDPRPSSRF